MNFLRNDELPGLREVLANTATAQYWDPHDEGVPAWNKGISASEETKKKMSKSARERGMPNASKMGRAKPSAEAKKKMSEARRAYWAKKHELQ